MRSLHSLVEDSLVEELKCVDCSGISEPPYFHIPPPPCHPGPNQILIDEARTCYTGYTNDNHRNISVSVLIVTVITFIVLAIVATVIVYRRRQYKKNRETKIPSIDDDNSCDDASAQQLASLSIRRCDLNGRPQHLFWTSYEQQNLQRYGQLPSTNTPSVRHKIKARERELSSDLYVTEHIYHTIPSESGSALSCQCTMQRDRRFQSLSPPFLGLQESESEEEDSLIPFLKGNSLREEALKSQPQYGNCSNDPTENSTC